MAIGVFGDLPDAGEASTVPAEMLEAASAFSRPLYWMFEMGQAALQPARAMADAGRLLCRNPANPLAHTQFGRTMLAGLEMFERTTRRYGKPEWRIDHATVGGVQVPVREEVIWESPFCRLLHFARDFAHPPRRPQPRLLIVAPLSGHYATLLRGTVETLLGTHDVYITDWNDARNVPVSAGRFDLDDYIDHVIEILHVLGGGTHVVAVCQPAVPVLAAVAVMEKRGDPDVPASMVLMGGPIDTRESPTAVNDFAKVRSIDWFRRNVITTVPFPHAGVMRQVYPGFLQLHGFMSMNLERHLQAHADMFHHLVKGDGDSAAKHREFYDEYLSVMDLPAEYYLQTLQAVFIDHSLPKGELTHRGETVDTTAIRNVALLTVEGENDDISGLGQTRAAHTLCPNIPEEKRAHYMQPTVGHYGVFNGSRFRAEIAPRIADFVLSNNWPRKGHNQPDAPLAPPQPAPVSEPAQDIVPVQEVAPVQEAAPDIAPEPAKARKAASRSKPGSAAPADLAAAAVVTGEAIGDIAVTAEPAATEPAVPEVAAAEAPADDASVPPAAPEPAMADASVQDASVQDASVQDAPVFEGVAGEGADETQPK